MLLEDYVEGFLTANETAKLEAHIANCTECLHTLEQLRTEQQLLASVLNEVTTTTHVSKNVMQQIQQKRTKKAIWQHYKMALIAAAVILISFALVATMNESLEQAEEPPLEKVLNDPTEAATPIDINNLLNGDPIFTVEIDSVEEKDGMKEITYRVNYTEPFKNYSEQTLEKLSNTYQLNKDEFSLALGTRPSLLIRNRNGEIVTTIDLPDWEKMNAIHPLISLYSSETENLGEEIVHFALPVETDPAMLEIWGSYTNFYTFSELISYSPNTQATFDFFDHHYTIEGMEITDEGAEIAVSFTGQPNVLPLGWRVQVGETTYHNVGYTETINNEKILIIKIPQLHEIPEEMTLIPYRGFIQQTFEQPIILDLKEAEER